MRPVSFIFVALAASPTLFARALPYPVPAEIRSDRFTATVDEGRMHNPNWHVIGRHGML